MLKKSTLVAALTVATVCGWAAQADAGIIGFWAVKRWYNHYAPYGHATAGWDYASTIGNGTWGSHPKHWARSIVHSVRPWPPVLDHYIGGWQVGGRVHFGGHGYAAYGHQGRWFHGHRHGHHAGCGCDACSCGHGHGGVAHWGGSGLHGWMGYGAYPSYGYYYGEAPLGDVVYDDVNGVIHDGGVPYPAGPNDQGTVVGPDGVIGPDGKVVPYDPSAAPKKEGELVDPPAKQPMKSDAPKSNAPAPPKSAAHSTTKLVLNVPADAKVILAGIDTKSHGVQREFVTNLVGEAAWSNYEVRVEFKHNGQMQVAERTITLHAGDHHEMTIDAGPSQVASK